MMCNSGKEFFIDFMNGQRPFAGGTAELLLWYDEQRTQTRAAWLEHKRRCPDCSHDSTLSWWRKAMVLETLVLPPTRV